MLVEGATGAAHHVLVALVVHLTEDCSQADVAEVGVDESGALGVEPL